MIEQSVHAGVTGMIAMGVNPDHNRRAVELAHNHDEVWAGVGHYPDEESEPDVDGLRSLAVDPRVVAIGEVGLDFQHGDIERERQIARLEAIFALAGELDLPVSIHNRGASDELVALIKQHTGVRGVMHYFALEWDWATKFLELGFYLSFAGLVTRPSRHGLREVVKRCPADRLLLETDSPYGNAHKRMGVPNQPAYLLDTAELVAELRGMSIGELGDLETANALTLFSKMR